MSAWYRRGWGPRLLAFALVAGLGASGCGKKAEPAPADEDKPSASTSRQIEIAPDPKVGAAVTQPAPAPVRDALHRSFAEATFSGENPPGDVEPPVDQTLTGKSAPALCEQVKQAWDTVRFTTADGRKIDYVAELNTSHGVIKMAILPELAPNHARNFLVLARLGYYDGLRFDRIHYEQIGPNALHCLEAGCPLGTGDAGTGSIGYWMKNERTSGAQCSHTEGVVGAYREVDPNGAATMFYVNLNSAPFRDGEYSLFARVIDGLDVVRTISKVATNGDSENGRARPHTPVVIHKVTIQEMIAEADKK